MAPESQVTDQFQVDIKTAPPYCFLLAVLDKGWAGEPFLESCAGLLQMPSHFQRLCVSTLSIKENSTSQVLAPCHKWCGGCFCIYLTKYSLLLHNFYFRDVCSSEFIQFVHVGLGRNERYFSSYVCLCHSLNFP